MEYLLVGEIDQNTLSEEYMDRNTFDRSDIVEQSHVMVLYWCIMII